MNPKIYFETIVLPTVREACADHLDRRRAYLAAMVTFHIYDYLKANGENNAYKKIKSEVGPHWEVVHGVCNGAKHHTLTKPHEIPMNAGEDCVRPPFILGHAKLGHSILGDSKGALEVKAPDGRRFDITGSVCVVVKGFAQLYQEHFGDADISDL